MKIDVEETNIGSHAILITKDGNIILQQRNKQKNLANSGLISMFGGTSKLNEQDDDALKREIMEELGIDIEGKDIRKMKSYKKTKDTDGVDWIVNVYIVYDIDLKTLRLYEGKSIYCTTVKEALNNKNLTRITRLALNDYSKLSSTSLAQR
jgi:8-oxo-dGTP pyrophosphatase MutT (NUDIX family)